MSNLDFLDAPAGEPTPAPEAQPSPEPVIEAQPAPEAEPADGRPRDEQGRFVSPTAAEVAAAAQPTPAQPGYVPVSAVQEERVKRQAAEEALARHQQAQAQTGIPDPYADPEGYTAYHEARTQQAVQSAMLNLSEDMARSKHGDETVDKVIEWAKGRFTQSPAYQQEVLTQRNPYEFAVQSYQREQALANVDMTELEAFRVWKAAQNNNPLAAPAATPSTPVTPPPVSLNSQPSAGGPTHIPTGPGVAFDGLFNRK